MWRNYNALVSLGGVVEAPGFIEQFHNLLSFIIGDCFTKTGTNLHANHF